MSHHPQCTEQHVPAPKDDAKPIGWEPYDGGRPMRRILHTCDTGRCTNTVYEFGVLDEDENGRSGYAITRIDVSSGEKPVIFHPADQGSTLETWLNLLKGTAH